MGIKKVTTLNIDVDILADSKGNPDIKSLSNWINNAYRAAFMNIEAEEKAILDLEHELVVRKDKLLLLKVDKDKLGIPERLFEWIKVEGRDRLARGATVKGVMSYFNNTYNQDLNSKQFKHYLELARQQTGERN
jgi:hypothetical protein